MQIAYTICSINYLPFAKALADSILRSNSQYVVYIVLAESNAAYNPADFSPHHIIPVTEMNLGLLHELNEKYTLFELSCALKPFAAEYLLHAVRGCETLFYFDADIFVYDKLSEAEQALQEHSILLTPHLINASSYTASIGTELEVLRSGVYNAGFFGLKKDDTCFAFLNWWKERVRHHCVNDAARGMFVDQLWLNFVPLYFPTTSILRHPGYNLAYWNLHERRLSVRNGKVIINGNAPLVFFHFSGYDPAKQDLMTKHQPGPSFAALPQLKDLFEQYHCLLSNNHLANYFSRLPTLGKDRSVARPKRGGKVSRLLSKWFEKK